MYRGVQGLYRGTATPQTKTVAVNWTNKSQCTLYQLVIDWENKTQDYLMWEQVHNVLQFKSHVTVICGFQLA